MSGSYSSSNGKRIKGELIGVRDLSLTPILNFEDERLQARAGPFYPPPSSFPFHLHNTIFKSTVITKKTCRVLIVAVMGIRSKGELTGVRNLFLTPVLNFEGERPWLEPVPHYSYYKTNPQVDFVITNLWFAYFSKKNSIKI